MSNNNEVINGTGRMEDVLREIEMLNQAEQQEQQKKTGRKPKKPTHKEVKEIDEQEDTDDGSVYGGDVRVVITRPNLRVAQFTIVGTSPLVMNRFSNKAEAQIIATQKAGQQAKSKKVRAPKDFDECFEGAKHVAEEGWYGIPASAFRSSMIRACTLVGFKMTQARMSVFCLEDGYGRDDRTPLVRLIAGEPEKFFAPVRNASGVIDIRCRPMWRKWSAEVNLRWDADQFSVDDVANLLMRAGMRVGLLEGRPGSTKSNGMGWGIFDVALES